MQDRTLHQDRTLSFVAPVRTARVTPLHTSPIGIAMTLRTSAHSASLTSAHSHLPLTMDTEAAVRSVRTMLKLTWTLALSAAAVWAFAHTSYLP